MIRSLPRVAILASLVLLSLMPAACRTAVAQSGSEDLVLAARVWGLAKYHHPQIIACQLDWDQALLDAFDAIDAAAGPQAASVAISALLDRAGDTPDGIAGADTPRWITELPSEHPLRARLAWLAAQQPQQQCYVSIAPNTGQAAFDTDRAHVTAEPDRALRALAAFRFWNAIEYFFPYKHDIGRDWADVLSDKLPAVLDAETRFDYVLAIRALTAAIEDSHAFLAHPPIHEQSGLGLPPFGVALIEGRTIVIHRRAESGSVQPGDELLAVDGVPVAEKIVGLEPLMHGSNPVFRQMLLLRSVLNGVVDPGRFLLRRPDGSEYEASLPRGFIPLSPLAQHPVWQQRELPGCRIGVVDLARLQSQDVPTALADLRSSDAIVFDIRNYPNGTLWTIVDELYASPRPAAHFTKPRFDQPGSWQDVVLPIGGTRPSPFAGRILLLQDERSISQSEYTLMGLQATGQSLVFGSQTAAADGNITHIELPGNIRATFTGLGVYYPDGRATQRIGIVPDVHVRPTIAGLAAGRDEVLEAALDCRWLTESPSPRLPPSGLYFAPERDGEGLDVHRDGDFGAVLSYGYDDAGQPEWLLSTGSLASTEWASTFNRHRGAPAPDAAAPGYAVDFHRGPYAPVCAIADQNALHPRGLWRWPGASDSDALNCVVPLLQSGNGRATGMWAGPPDEHGWGLSVHQSADRISVIVYAYDGDDRPRWIIGNAPWDGNSEVSIPLQHFSGFCRACAAQPLAITPAGALQLRFAGLDTRGEGSTLSIDADFGDGARWTRQQMPISRLLGASSAEVADERASADSRSPGSE